MRTPIPAAVTVATLALSGCATATSATSQATARQSQPPQARPARAGRAPRGKTKPHPGHRARHLRPGARSTGGATRLPVSTASNQVVQPQPAPGSCHQIGSGLYARPDPACTPGALNPAVTQATIGNTICASGWTATVRPPEAITEQEKTASIAAYADSGPLSAYEYDHFVPLELGGATNDARNLWPEPGATPNPKDAVEDELRREVCDGQVSLSKAQHTIAKNWVALARRASAAAPAGRVTAPGATSREPGASARCTVTASYNTRHHDYDVYVGSNQPDQAVTVTDSAGGSRSWHTDGAGSADVYFDAGGAAGEQITVHVGEATCSGRL